MEMRSRHLEEHVSGPRKTDGGAEGPPKSGDSSLFLLPHSQGLSMKREPDMGEM